MSAADERREGASAARSRDPAALAPSRRSGRESEPVVRLVEGPAIPAAVASQPIGVGAQDALAQPRAVVGEIALLDPHDNEAGAFEALLACVVFAVLISVAVAVRSVRSPRRTVALQR